MRRIKNVIAGVIVFSLMASLPGCHKTDSSEKNSSADGYESRNDSSETIFQVGEDTTNYFSCKNLDYSLPDNESKLTVYGGMISDASIWTVVLSETDDPTVYLEQFDLDGNREDTIELGSFSDVELGYDNPYMYEDDQSVYIVSYPFSDALQVYQVNKKDHKVSGSAIKLEGAHIGEMLGFREGLFYVESLNNSGEVVCYGYDLSSGECKYKSEPDAEAKFYVWQGENLFQLNQTSKDGVYRVFEISPSGKVVDRGEFGMPSDYGRVQYYNGKQYFDSDKGVWCLNEESGIWENIVLWSISGMDMTDVPADVRIVSKNQERVFTCGRDNKNICLFQPGDDPQKGKTSLLIVEMFPSDSVTWAIQEFNRNSTTCVIEYKTFEDILDSDNYLDQDGWVDYAAYDEAVFDYLWKAVSQGNGPDILIRYSNDSGEKFESRFYEYGGLLQDLLPLWEKEDPKWRNQYFTNLIDVMKNGNSLYSIPYEYELINYVLLDKSSEALATKPTYSDWVKYMDDHSDGRALINMTGRAFLLNCLCYDSVSFVDESSNKSLFSSQEFKDLLRLSKEYCLSEDEWNNGNLRDSVFATKRIGGNNSSEISLNYDYSMEGQFYGLISKAGGHACLSGQTVSITSKCKDVEAAWEFIKLLLSPETQEYRLRQDDAERIGMSFFPILRSSADYMLDFYLVPKNHEEYWSYRNASLEEEWTIDMMTPMTEEEAQKVRDFISSVDYVNYSDIEIVNVVMEESAPYFAGQKSLDEVVAIIDNRVQTILNERQ